MLRQSEGRIIIGTAGHVDHGKTALIKAITGIDTDRLKEEQERGMTIDLGFASIRLPNGIVAGIVDVPGHERFIKNMLAGAVGVDVALLVIAADEGIMPQTREHLEILELLEAKAGVAALTKCDIVSPEWIDLVEDDVRAELAGTFLDGAPIIRVSSVTGEGLPELLQALADAVSQIEPRSSSGPFRLPIDRVFTITGFGTVVTGTLVSGAIRTGDLLRILPKGIESRARQLQVHGEKVEEAYAGSRVAVNLAGVDVSDIERGCVIVPYGYLSPSNRLDILIRILPNAPKPLKNRMRVRMHIGTAEHIGRVIVLSGGEIPAGGEGFAQFVSETPVTAARNDRFVIRTYSPMHTIGGGLVLDPLAPRHRLGDLNVIDALQRRLNGDPADIFEDVLLVSSAPLSIKDAAAAAGISENEAGEIIKRMGFVVIGLDKVVHPAVLSALKSQIISSLESYHQTKPLRAGMPREDLRAAAARKLDSKTFQFLLTEMEFSGEIVLFEHLVRLPTHSVKLSERQEKLAQGLEDLYRSAAFDAPAVDDALAKTGASRDVLYYLIETGRLVMIDDDIVLHSSAVEHAKKLLINRLADGGSITVSEFRDVIGSSRKYAVPLLEYFDSQRITRRVGDSRILVRKTS